MTTQVYSFIVFGIAFVLLYLFYKKNDRKIVLLVSGLFFLLPFTFDNLLLDSDHIMLVIPISTGFFILARFIKHHSRYFFLFFGIYFISVVFTIRHVEILKGYYRSTLYVVFTSSTEYTYKSGELVLIPTEKPKTFINDTESFLYVESVEYGQGFFQESSSSNQIVQNIPPFSAVSLKHGIDYYFQDPPAQITTYRKQGEPIKNKTTEYWLHQ
jgi:hypothetical protein